MSPKRLYLALCIAGTILPYWQFVPFLRDHGPDLRLFFQQLFANPVSGFFGMDVIVSSVVLWTLVFSEGRRLGMKNLWAPVAANLAVGVRSACRCSSTCAKGGSRDLRFVIRDS
jgi:hypothetical protein